MTEEREIALAPRQELSPSLWQMISQIAPVVYESRLFGVHSPEQAASIMLKGHELGLTLTASFEFIDVIKGTPGLKPRGALALILQSPEYEDVKVTEENGSCTVWMKRKNGFEHTIRFTMEDAKQANLIKPDSGWAKYPANMLRWRAIGFCADIVFPDVIGGMKRTDELGADITEDGDTIDIEWNISTPNTEYGMPTLEALLTQYSAEQIMEANDGKIPDTDEAVKAVAEKLEAGNEMPTVQ